jgi:serine/threonine protein kinase
MLHAEVAWRIAACSQREYGPDSLWQGLTLAGRYQIEQWLGEGAHALVQRALDLHTGAQVAIKQNENRPQAVREARLLSELEHQGLVPLQDFLFDQVAAYLVLPFIESLPLRAWTAGAEDTPRLLPLGEVLEVGRQLSQIFAYLHGQASPVAHRDVHSENLLRMPDGRIRLIDFSLAERLEARAPTTLLTLGNDLSNARALLARLLSPGAAGELAWRLRGCPHPGVPFTAQQLECDLCTLEQELQG